MSPEPEGQENGKPKEFLRRQSKSVLHLNDKLDWKGVHSRTVSRLEPEYRKPKSGTPKEPKVGTGKVGGAGTGETGGSSKKSSPEAAVGAQPDTDTRRKPSLKIHTGVRGATAASASAVAVKGGKGVETGPDGGGSGSVGKLKSNKRLSLVERETERQRERDRNRETELAQESASSPTYGSPTEYTSSQPALRRGKSAAAAAAKSDRTRTKKAAGAAGADAEAKKGASKHKKEKVGRKQTDDVSHEAEAERRGDNSRALATEGTRHGNSSSGGGGDGGGAGALAPTPSPSYEARFLRGQQLGQGAVGTRQPDVYDAATINDDDYDYDHHHVDDDAADQQSDGMQQHELDDDDLHDVLNNINDINDIIENKNNRGFSFSGRGDDAKYEKYRSQSSGYGLASPAFLVQGPSQGGDRVQQEGGRAQRWNSSSLPPAPQFTESPFKKPDKRVQREQTRQGHGREWADGVIGAEEAGVGLYSGSLGQLNSMLTQLDRDVKRSLGDNLRRSNDTGSRIPIFQHMKKEAKDGTNSSVYYV